MHSSLITRVFSANGYLTVSVLPLSHEPPSILVFKSDIAFVRFAQANLYRTGHIRTRGCQLGHRWVVPPPKWRDLTPLFFHLFAFTISVRDGIGDDFIVTVVDVFHHDVEENHTIGIVLEELRRRVADLIAYAVVKFYPQLLAQLVEIADTQL